MRRFNYTGRKKISLSDVDINLIKVENSRFATLNIALNLNEYELPQDASVILEAYRNMTSARFELGHVHAYQSSVEIDLAMFGDLHEVKYRVRVVASKGQGGVIAAYADRISLSDPDKHEENRQSILPVETADLDGLVWKVDFRQDGPVLVIEKTLDKNALAKSIEFQSLVMPELINKILSHILFPEPEVDLADPNDWQTQWLKFCSALPGVGALPSLDDDSDDEQFDDFIAAASSGFAKRITARQFVDQFLNG